MFIKCALEQANLNHIATDSALIFDDDCTHIACLHFREQGVQTGSVERCARHTIIHEKPSVSKSMVFRVLREDLLLVCDAVGFHTVEPVLLAQSAI